MRSVTAVLFGVRFTEQQLTISVKTEGLQTVQSDDGRSTCEQRSRHQIFSVSISLDREPRDGDDQEREGFHEKDDANGKSIKEQSGNLCAALATFTLQLTPIAIPFAT